jgi:hypothetical protein
MFADQLVELLQADATFTESLWIYAVGIFDAWGAPMLLGCVPWAIGSAFLGYWWSLRLVRRFRLKRRDLDHRA